MTILETFNQNITLTKI